MDEAPLAFVDLEMTGLDAKRDRIVQICVERVVGGEVVDALCSFVDAGRGPGPSAIHGITEEHLRSAPSFREVAPRVLAILEGACFVAHGARWDIAFLAAELARLGTSFEREHYIDTLALSRRLLRRDCHRLHALAADLGIDSPRPHRADNDVRVTRALFAALLGDLEAACPLDVWRGCAAKRSVRSDIVAAAKRALALRDPVLVRYRPSGKGPRELRLHVTAVRTDLDPPLVLGYLQHTRGRRELRADRILELRPVGHETNP